MNKLINGSATTAVNSPQMDKNKDWQLELLMEKLRSKSGQLRSFPDISKTVRMTMLDKRYSLDSVEKSQHQKCLDTLQHCIKVTSLQSMIERLESLTRQLGLKSMVGPSGVEVFISSDMFYLEIILDQNGIVRDVKVHHEGKPEQQSCSELVSCLSRQDFTDFTAQLEGFASIYQLNAEKKVKCKAFTALQSLESDLSTLAQLQPFKEPFSLIHKSPVGILEKRRGGHPMKLTYFVSPYDLLDTEKCELEPITIEKVTGKNLGYSVTVCMEGSTAHKLQTTTLITINRGMNGKGTPLFNQLNNQNSSVIPACFVLKLSKPMPMCVALINQIQQLIEIEWVDVSNAKPLLSLITTHVSDGKVTAGNNKGLFVTLPDQHHCYFMTENKTMNGILINSVPFSHPGHVSQILNMLRQQALFNTIIGSCVRPNSKQDLETMVVFEVSVLSWSQISIALEHPLEETMATAELDLSDISNLQCHVLSPGNSTMSPSNPDSISEIATKVFNRCFSIPITMRAIIRQWDKQSRKNHFNGLENFSLPLGNGDPGGARNPLNDFGGKVKQESSGINLLTHPHQGVFLSDLGTNFPGFPPEPTLTNLELTNILTGSEQNRRWTGRKTPDIESSSCDSTSRSEQDQVNTPSTIGFHSDIELGIDPTDLIAGDKSSLDELDTLNDFADMEEMFGSRTQKRMIDTDIFTEGKIVSPSVSITPVTPRSISYTTGMERKGGIEIIPIPSTASTLPSSITITPITPSQAKASEERNRDKKRNRDDKNRLDKKKRKKRDNSPMGPPEKIPSKNDPLTKPVSVSIKPAESPPLPLIPPTSPIMKKFTTSPTHKTFTVSGKLSPNLIKSGIKSPKHSPAHISSPKHVTSPKHPSGTSGKPSMSTLKNAANSPIKNEKLKVIRDKKLQLNSIKKSKIKPLDLNLGADIICTENNLSPSISPDLNKTNIQRNRKGLLSAVIDKLKSAQNCDLTIDPKLIRDRGAITMKMEGIKPGLKVNDIKNSEYMVKSSSDGIKITINKTRKETKTGGIKLSGANSPKTHTGLKPGVNSGPASKKPQQIIQKTSSPTFTNSLGFNFNKINSNKIPKSLGLISKNLKLGTKSPVGDLSRKDRPRIKSTEKSIFSRERKSSPTQIREESESEKAFKLAMVNNPYSGAPIMAEGLIKTLDKNFQIPKLSARNTDEKKPKNEINRNEPNKIFDLMVKNDVKYPIALPTPKIFDTNMEVKIRNSMMPLELTAAKEEEPKKDTPIIAPPPKTFPADFAVKSVDLTTMFEKKDAFLDKIALPLPPVTSSSSVSVHIVKSPAPSPMINPSPHSASPCITDDELMDEALVGLGK